MQEAAPNETGQQQFQLHSRTIPDRTMCISLKSIHHTRENNKNTYTEDHVLHLSTSNWPYNYVLLVLQSASNWYENPGYFTKRTGGCWHEHFSYCMWEDQPLKINVLKIGTQGVQEMPEIRLPDYLCIQGRWWTSAGLQLTIIFPRLIQLLPIQEAGQKISTT